MAIEIEELKEAAEKIQDIAPVIEQPVVVDGWSKHVDSIVAGDFTGLQLAIMIFIGIIFLRPLIALATYAAGFFAVFLLVKHFVAS